MIVVGLLIFASVFDGVLAGWHYLNGNASAAIGWGTASVVLAGMAVLVRRLDKLKKELRRVSR